MKEVIPRAELVAAPRNFGEVSPAEVYRLLATKVVRGHTISKVLSMILLMTTAVAVMEHQYAWAVAAFVSGFLFGFAATMMQRKLSIARQVSENPSLVYWAHPTILRQQISARTMDTTFITLHCRTGESFEVAMAREEMLTVVGWLRHHNPDVRLGSYDDVSC
jgi:hypothetical protein